MELFTITRKLEIDMGHRVPSHKGKCRNMHGHRYVIEASFSAQLQREGSEEGMVTDFGNIKALLEDSIEDHYDHAFAWYIEDEVMRKVIEGPAFGLKHVELADVPTAENLARIWYITVDSHVEKYLGMGVTLDRIKVYETPNCWAVYPYVQGGV